MKKLSAVILAPEKRIYCVVAQKVQAPLNEERVYTSNFGGMDVLKPVRTEDTETIKQPPGRIVAQHGHAVSMVREACSESKSSIASCSSSRSGTPPSGCS